MRSLRSRAVQSDSGSNISNDSKLISNNVKSNKIKRKKNKQRKNSKDNSKRKPDILTNDDNNISLQSQSTTGSDIFINSPQYAIANEKTHKKKNRTLSEESPEFKNKMTSTTAKLKKTRNSFSINSIQESTKNRQSSKKKNISTNSSVIVTTSLKNRSGNDSPAYEMSLELKNKNTSTALKQKMSQNFNDTDISSDIVSGKKDKRLSTKRNNNDAFLQLQTSKSDASVKSSQQVIKSKKRRRSSNEKSEFKTTTTKPRMTRNSISVNSAQDLSINKKIGQKENLQNSSVIDTKNDLTPISDISLEKAFSTQECSPVFKNIVTSTTIKSKKRKLSSKNDDLSSSKSIKKSIVKSNSEKVSNIIDEMNSELNDINIFNNDNNMSGSNVVNKTESTKKDSSLQPKIESKKRRRNTNEESTTKPRITRNSIYLNSTQDSTSNRKIYKKKDVSQISNITDIKKEANLTSYNTSKKYETCLSSISDISLEKTFNTRECSPMFKNMVTSTTIKQKKRKLSNKNGNSEKELNIINKTDEPNDLSDTALFINVSDDFIVETKTVSCNNKENITDVLNSTYLKIEDISNAEKCKNTSGEWKVEKQTESIINISDDSKIFESNLNNTFTCTTNDNKKVGFQDNVDASLNKSVRKKWQRFARNSQGANSILEQINTPQKKSAINNKSLNISQKLNKTANPSTIKKPSAIKRTAMPNFALLHQKAFDKMESISDYSQRKKERANLLLSTNKKNQLTDKSEPKEIHGNKFKSSRQLFTKNDKIEPTNAKFNRFGFKLKSIPHPNPPITNLSVQQRSIQPQNEHIATVKPSIYARHEVVAIANKKVQGTGKLRDNKRYDLKGVRTNRRFDLLMKMRNN